MTAEVFPPYIRTEKCLPESIIFHEEKTFLLGNEVIKAEVGSVITSELKLMKRWKWGKEKTRNYLKLLEKLEMIEKRPDHKKTYIVKWSALAAVAGLAFNCVFEPARNQWGLVWLGDWNGMDLSQRAPALHNGGLNVCFCDSHAKYHKQNAFLLKHVGGPGVTCDRDGVNENSPLIDWQSHYAHPQF